MTKKENLDNLKKNYYIIASDGELLLHLEQLKIRLQTTNLYPEQMELIREELLRTVTLLEELSYDCSISRSLL